MRPKLSRRLGVETWAAAERNRKQSAMTPAEAPQTVQRGDSPLQPPLELLPHDRPRYRVPVHASSSRGMASSSCWRIWAWPVIRATPAMRVATRMGKVYRAGHVDRSPMRSVAYPPPFVPILQAMSDFLSLDLTFDIAAPYPTVK